MSTRFLTERDGEKIAKALSDIEKKIEEFKPEIDDSEIIGGYYIPVVDANGNLSWLASKEGMPAVAGSNISGPRGERGLAGVSATHKWSGTSLTISSASGSSTRDLQGPKGDKGDTGQPGPSGKSAYDYAKDGGFAGTEEEFIEMLVGKTQTELPPSSIPEIGTMYFLGEIDELSIGFPQTAKMGDMIYVCFSSGEKATSLTISTNNHSGLDGFNTKQNASYELIGMWNGSKWMMVTHEIN